MLKRKYFNRILTGYILVAVVFTLIFAGYFYAKNNQIIEKDLAHKGEFTLIQIAKNVDLRLGLCYEASQRLSGYRQIMEFANETDPDQLVRYNVSELLINDTAFQLNKGVKSYITNLSDVVIGRESTQTPSDFFTYFGIDTPPNKIAEFLNNNPNYDNVFAVSSGANALADKNYLIIIKSIQTQGRGVYLLDVFDPDLLFDISQNPKSAFVLKNQDSVICSVGYNQTSREAINSIVNQSRIPGIGEKPLYEGKFMYQSVRSGMYNWNYVLATPIEGNDMRSNQLFLISLGLGLLICLISVIVMLFITRRMYSPINQLVESFEKYDEDNDSGDECRDEIAYIKNTVKKIGSTKDDLLEMLQMSKAPLQTKFLRDLLYGLVQEEQTQELAGKLKLNNYKTPYTVAILDLSGYDLLIDAFSKEAIFAIKEEILKFINNQLSGTIIHEVLELDNRKFAIISYGVEQNKLRSLLMNVIMMVEGNFEVEMMATIGGQCDSLYKISDSFALALYILENRFSVGWRNTIITIEDLNDISKDTFYYPLETERDIIANVVRGRAEEAKRMVLAVLSENLEKRRLSKEKTNAFIFALTATINRIIESLGTNADKIFDEGTIAFLDLKMCQTSTQLSEKAFELFSKLSEFVVGTNKRNEDDIATRLLDYIHENYNKDISLLDIGGYFNLSQCYVSTLFKEATGENFKEYLSHYRISKAKQILAQNPSIKAKDLAAAIGCNTSATLFRLFNKYEGMSPGQYVKKMRSNASD